jgi:rod shape-determining protein MreD
MRWLTYFILAYLAIGLQLGAGDLLTIAGAKPNLVLLAVIFIAINAPREPALLGCVGIGLMQDLVNLQPLGLYAAAYGLVGMFVVSTQEIVYREHPLTHFSLGFVGCLLVAAVVLVHGLVRPPRVAPGALFGTAVYTAALAPLVLWGLQRIKRVFSFTPPRRRLRTI